MSREIKFRALSIHGKRDWQVGTYSKTCLYPNAFTGDYINSVLIDVETIGQFTGLKDKNGVEIFEGDIVETIFNVHGKESSIRFNSKIIYNEHVPGYQISYKNGNDHFVSDNIMSRYFLNIIGNIHQNPELL